MAKLKRQDELTKLFDKLVPSEGNAKTIAGEIVRALNRIIYRWINDDDRVGDGYGKETVNPAVRYLASIKGLNSNKVIKDFLDEANGYFRLKNYEKDLEQLLSTVLDFLRENPELMTKKNKDDYWDFANEELDRIDFDEDDMIDDDGYDDYCAIRDTFNAIKSQCKTKYQRLAFNELLSMFNIVPDQKDIQRAKDCPSEAKASAMVSSIKDIDKLLRRAKAFIEVWGFNDDKTYPFLLAVEGKLNDNAITQEQFEDTVGFTVDQYFKNKQPEAIKQLNKWLYDITKAKLELSRIMRWSNEREYTAKEKYLTKLINGFKEWLSSSTRKKLNLNYTEVDNSLMQVKFVHPENKYYKTVILDEYIPSGELAKAIENKEKVAERVADKLKRLSALNSIVYVADKNKSLDRQDTFIISGPTIQDWDKRVKYLKELNNKYASKYPASISFDDNLNCHITPKNIAKVDIIPTLPTDHRTNPISPKYSSLVTDQEKINFVINSLTTDVNKSEDEFMTVVDEIISEFSKLKGVGKTNRELKSKNWVLKSTKDLTMEDLNNFPALIYVDENIKGFTEQGHIKSLYFKDKLKSGLEQMTLGSGNISIGGSNVSISDINTFDDVVINPFFIEKSDNLKIAKVIKEALTRVGHPEAYSAEVIKLVKKKAKQMMNNYREIGILKSFSYLKSNCKTKSQRIAFNSIVKSFSNLKEVSKDDLKKFIISKFNKSPQAGEYNILKLIEFIQENSEERPLSNQGGRLNQIQIKDGPILAYSYEKNTKKITCGFYSIVGQWVNNSWTWWVKEINNSKKVTSGEDVIDIVNKMLNTKYSK